MTLPTDSHFRPSRLRPWHRRVAAIAVVGAAAATTLAAFSQPPHDRGGDFGPGPGLMMDGPPDHMVHHIDRLLDGLGVTSAQRAQIRQIVVGAAGDLRSQRDAGRDLRDRAARLFVAPTVDEAAAESLRQQIETQRDQASKRMLSAMLDISKVLTPEQRAKIGARMEERRAVMHDRMERMEQERQQERPQERSPMHPKP